MDIILPVKHVYQIGPTCGLALLQMCYLYYFKQDIPVSSLLDQAISLSLTRQGELFSASALATLGSTLSLSCSVQTLASLNIPLILSQNKLVAIPYDKDKNNAPGLFEGRQCHWALAVAARNRAVGCLHGKSRLMGVWDWDQLVASNAQLFTPHPCVRERGLVCAEDLAGVRDKCVVLWKDAA